MNFISYGGSVYVTDGFSRRRISNPTQLNELHAAAGKPPIQAVSKGTFDSLEEFVQVRHVRNDISNVGAQVENLRRIVVDHL